jgi:RNA-directed DNA polymerase
MAWCRSGGRGRRKVVRYLHFWLTYCWMKWTRYWNEGATASCAMPMMRTSMFAATVPGQRVMALLLKLYGRLRLTVNSTKSTVSSVFQRKFLGYSFWVAPGGKIKRRVANKAVAKFKQRVRELTRRSGGYSLETVVKQLRIYVLGWKAYFRLAQTPGVWRELDQWIRHRMRAIQLKHWKRGTTAYRELVARGASQETAQLVARNTRRWWRNSEMLLHKVLHLRWADRLGIPQLA